MTLSPFTTTPVSRGVDRPADAAPWSARHAQMSSRMTLSLFTTRLVVALPTCRAADAEEDVVEGRRIGGVALVRVLSCLPASSVRAHGTGVEQQPRDLDALHVGDGHRGDPVLGSSVAKPSPRTTVSARLTSIVLSRWYTPGVKIRLRPLASALLMSLTSSDGCARKNRRVGSTSPRWTARPRCSR